MEPPTADVMPSRAEQRRGWSTETRIEQAEYDLDTQEIRWREDVKELNGKLDRLNGRLWGFTIAMFTAAVTIIVTVALAVAR